MYKVEQKFQYFNKELFKEHSTYKQVLFLS